MQSSANPPDEGSVASAPSGASLQATGWGEILQACALLLPPALLAWPGGGSLLAHDLVPQLTGAGVALLASLPAAVLLIVRRAAPGVRGLTFLLLPLLFAVGWISTGAAQDTLEAARAINVACTALVLILCGASLGHGGRLILARGVVCLSLALTGFALFDRAHAGAGALGNTGSLSESALAGALIGALLRSYERGPWRLACFLALAALLTYTARTPVLAGALSAFSALALAAWFGRSLTRRVRAVCAGTAVIALLCVAVPLMRSRAGDHAPDAASERAAQERSKTAALVDQGGAASGAQAGDTGGIEVRLRIWARSARMLRDHAWLGIGPGQFAASFPPYRDPREIELSTHARTLANETEVEHAHNDWIEIVLEAGVLVGLAWVAFLLTLAASSIECLRRRADAADAGLSTHVLQAACATAALGLLVNALFSAPLTYDPASSCIAFALFGCVLARKAPPAASISRRFVPLGAAALLAVNAPRALAMVEHGRALATLAADDGETTLSTAEALAKALEACPDSVLARTLNARVLESEKAKPARIRDEWLSVLALRPNRVEALMQQGYLAAIEGDTQDARAWYERALAVDAAHPGSLRNMMSLEFQDENSVAALGYFDRLEATHPIERAWLLDYAARLHLRGQEREARALFARVEPKLSAPSAEQAMAWSKEHRQGGRPVLADALESYARRSWGREQARSQHAAEAVRNYRQDLRITRDYVEGGALRTRLELVAALLLAGRDDEAASEGKELRPSERDWQALPDWARERLRATDWFER